MAWRACINAQGTLVGLLAAFSYELSILAAASRLTSADAFRTLHALYRGRTHPLPSPVAPGESARAAQGGDNASGGSAVGDDQISSDLSLPYACMHAALPAQWSSFIMQQLIFRPGDSRAAPAAD